MALWNPTKVWPQIKLIDIFPEKRPEFNPPRWVGPIPHPHDEPPKASIALSPFSSPMMPAPLRINSKSSTSGSSPSSSNSGSSTSTVTLSSTATSRSTSPSNAAGSGPLSLSSTWHRACILHHTGADVLAYQLFSSLLHNPRLPEAHRPRLALNMAVIAGEMGDGARAAAVARRAVAMATEAPSGCGASKEANALAALAVFMLGLVAFDADKAGDAAKCFGMCLELFAPEQDGIDFRGLGLDFVLLKADIKANKSVCVEKERVQRVVQMRSEIEWDVVRMPEGSIFQPVLEEPETEAPKKGEIDEKAQEEAPAKQVLQRLWDLYLDKPLPALQTKNKQRRSSFGVERAVKKLFGSFAF